MFNDGKTKIDVTAALELELSVNRAGVNMKVKED